MATVDNNILMCSDTQPHYVKTDLTALIQEAQRKMVRYTTMAATNGTANDNHDVDASPSSSPSEGAQLDPAAGAFTFSDLIKIQAPMVRCSRPAFRKLCRLWGTTISYTHMIMSESFAQSAEARASDFSLYDGEDRLIVQLAGTSGPTMAAAAALVAPYCDAVDINCGCPQKWAMREGIGSALLTKPELVADMVKCIWNAVPGERLPCVVKMRVNEDIRHSVDFARQVEAAGASWITVHGRTPWDTPSSIIRTPSITTIRDSVQVPVVANGSVECPRSALGLALSAGVGSVMSARGLLSNPAAFFNPHPEEHLTFPLPLLHPTTGQAMTWGEHAATNTATAAHFAFSLAADRSGVLLSSCTRCPLEVISDFLRLSAMCDLPLKATQQHILYMANHYLSPAERSFVSQQRSNVALFRAMQSVGLYTAEGGKV